MKKLLTITKDNYLDFLESKLAIHIKAGKRNYFLQQLKSLCRVVPEFTHRPILSRKNKLLHYDSKFYWKDNTGRCSLQFQNSWFGFDDKKVSGFKYICIDYKSFDIKQIGDKKVHKMCGVPIDYLSLPEQKLQQKQQVKELKKERAEIIAELKAMRES